MRFLVMMLMASMILPAWARELRTCEWRMDPSLTDAQIRATVDRLAALGMNGVRVETFYHGGTIYHSAVMRKWGMPDIRPDYAARPKALRTLIEAAHARHIAVYAWVETFYVWNTILGAYNPILAKHPEWSVRNADGSILPKHGEKTYCFISPANLQARRFIRDLYTEIAKLGVDGILFDYLRYPVGSLGPEDALSYDDASIRRTKAELGLDIRAIRADIEDPDFQRWTKWRLQQTTDFARELARAVKAANPKIVFAASVHPYTGPDWRKLDTLRDWPQWYPDITVFSPQYYADAQAARQWAAGDLKYLGSKAVLWPNLLESDIAAGSPALLSLRGPRVVGFSHWKYDTLTDADGEALRSGPYRQEAGSDNTKPGSRREKTDTH